jgi:hypothetical protein
MSLPRLTVPTKEGGKKADRLQLEVDPKLLVSSKSRGPAPHRHIPTHAPSKRQVCLHHASYTCRALPDCLHTLTLSEESLCVSTASTGLRDWRWRRLEENELGLFRHPLDARLGQSSGVKVLCRIAKSTSEAQKRSQIDSPPSTHTLIYSLSVSHFRMTSIADLVVV